MQDSDLDQLRRLEPTDAYFAAAAARGVEMVVAGPFRLLADPHAGALDEVVPVEPLGGEDVAADAVRELRRLLVEEGRAAELAFNDPLFPGLPPVLEAEGFVEHDREPIMLCTPQAFRPVLAPGIAVRFLRGADPDADLAAYRAIFSSVMGMDLWTSSDDVRSEVARGMDRTHALATVDGEPAGTGYISSFDGVAEITRVSTLPEARRRGVAATLTSFMVGDRFASEDTLVWLTAQNPAAQALYEKLGFRRAGARRYYRVAP